MVYNGKVRNLKDMMIKTVNKTEKFLKERILLYQKLPIYQYIAKSRINPLHTHRTHIHFT